MRTVLVLCLVAMLTGVEPAGAGQKQRIAAANAVERKLDRTHGGYRWVASCRQRTATRFTCSFTGIRRARSGSGQAHVRRSGSRYYVTLGKVTFS